MPAYYHLIGAVWLCKAPFPEIASVSRTRGNVRFGVTAAHRNGLP
jgi:hypothetical protein